MIEISRFSKDSEPFLHAEFGKGDILMLATEKGADDIVCMVFENIDPPREIGLSEAPGDITLRDTKPLLVFSFSKIESIDAVIGILNKCKEEFLNKRSCKTKD